MPTRSLMLRSSAVVVLAIAVPLASGTVAGAVPRGAVATSTTAAAYPATPTSTVPVGSNPYDVAISQRRDRAYVVNDGSVSELSLLTKTKVTEYSTGGGEGQNAIALVQNDSQAYITNFQKTTVTVLDTKLRAVVRTIPVGAGAVDVVEAVSPGPDLAYVAFGSDPRLVGINTRTAKVVQTVDLPEPAQTLTAHPSTNTVWAGSNLDGKIFVVDTSSGTVTSTIDVSVVGPVVSIAFDPDRRHVWVVGLGAVAVLDLQGSIQRVLPLGTLFTSGGIVNPGTIALNGSGTYAYVENSTFPDAPARGEIAVIDTTSYAVVAHIPTGVEPESFALDTVRGQAYVPNYADDTVTTFPIPK